MARGSRRDLMASMGSGEEGMARRFPVSRIVKPHPREKVGRSAGGFQCRMLDMHGGCEVKKVSSNVPR